MSSKRLKNNKTLAKRQKLIISQLFSGKVTRIPSTPQKQPLKLTFQEFPLLGDCSALSEHQDEESVSMSTSDSEEDRGVKRDFVEIEPDEQEKTEWIHIPEHEVNAETDSEQIETKVDDISDEEFADQCEALEEEFQEKDDDYDPYPDCNNKYYSQEFDSFYQNKIRGNKLVYRKTHKNKKDKVKPGRCINANVQRREKEKIEQILSEVAKQKENARKNITQTIDCGWYRRGEPLPVGNNNNNQFGNAVYEKDLQKAMTASRTETHESGLTYAQLMELLSRDLTPEDYEMLLALDTTVQKKTTDTNSIKALKELVATEGHCKELCTVCMCNYDVGDPLKSLPCEHMFHKECITTWLEKHSQSCPLCNAKV